MNQNNSIINGLWIGTELNPLEQLCIQSFIRNGHIFQLWTYSIIRNIPEGTIIKNANDIIDSKDIFSYVNTNKFGHGKGSYAGFSDIFRYKLLYEYGGWWTDMDITCLKKLDFEDDYVFRQNGAKGVVGNLLKCPPKSILMQYCYENAVQQITQDNKDWMLPINILNSGIEKFNLNQFIRKLSSEDSWVIISKLLTSDTNFEKDWYVIHWMNEEWRRFELDKNAFVPTSAIERLLTTFHVHHALLNKKQSKMLHYKLGKWNYRFINIKARIHWYTQLLRNKLKLNA